MLIISVQESSGTDTRLPQVSDFVRGKGQRQELAVVEAGNVATGVIVDLQAQIMKSSSNTPASGHTGVRHLAQATRSDGEAWTKCGKSFAARRHSTARRRSAHERQTYPVRAHVCVAQRQRGGGRRHEGGGGGRGGKAGGHARHSRGPGLHRFQGTQASQKRSSVTCGDFPFRAGAKVAKGRRAQSDTNKQTKNIPAGIHGERLAPPHERAGT